MKLLLLTVLVLFISSPLDAALPPTGNKPVQVQQQFGTGLATNEAPDPIVDHPISRAKRTSRFPKFCACKKLKGRPGKCYYFLKSTGYKCKQRTCTPRHVCIAKKYLKKYLKKQGAGKKVTVCIKRVTNKKVVPWIKKGKKGYCKPIKTRKMIFYVPYVRAKEPET